MFKYIITIFPILFCLNAFAADLVVYTSRKEHLIKDIFKQYTEETGVKVTYKTGDAAALIQSIKAEGEKSPADIFMTVDAGNLWYAGSEGLLEATSSSKLRKNVPFNLRDEEGRWFGLSIRARTIAFNPKKSTSFESLSFPLPFSTTLP